MVGITEDITSVSGAQAVYKPNATSVQHYCWAHKTSSMNLMLYSNLPWVNLEVLIQKCFFYGTNNLIINTKYYVPMNNSSEHNLILQTLETDFCTCYMWSLSEQYARVKQTIFLTYQFPFCLQFAKILYCNILKEIFFGSWNFYCWQISK